MRLAFLAIILVLAFVAYQALFKKPEATAPAGPTDPADKTRHHLAEIKNTAPEDRPAKVAQIIKDSSLTPEAIKEILNEVQLTTARQSEIKIIVPESFASAPYVAMAIPAEQNAPVLTTSPLKSVIPHLEPVPVFAGISANSFDSPGIVKNTHLFQEMI